MSTETKRASRAYELMVIVDASLDDDVIAAQVTRIAELITQQGAEIRSEDRWGKRRFAYEINHQQEGYYVLFEFVGGGGFDQLERSLRLADEVVRHKLLRIPEREAVKRGHLEQATN